MFYHARLKPAGPVTSGKESATLATELLPRARVAKLPKFPATASSLGSASDVPSARFLRMSKGFTQAAARREAKSRDALRDLEAWQQNLPAILRAPSDFSGFSLWTATLQIANRAALLRAAALVPEQADSVVSQAATEISAICLDLFRQGFLYSLWSFGIHELDLVMGQHARRVNSQDPELMELGLQSLRDGLPMMNHLCERSSVASQGARFYKMLLEAAERGELPG